MSLGRDDVFKGLPLFVQPSLNGSHFLLRSGFPSGFCFELQLLLDHFFCFFQGDFFLRELNVRRATGGGLHVRRGGATG